MLDSRGGAADHEVGRIVVVLALSSPSLAEDRTRSSLCQEHVELDAQCRTSLSEAEVAGNLGWRTAEVGKWSWDRILGVARVLTGSSGRRPGSAPLPEPSPRPYHH